MLRSSNRRDLRPRIACVAVLCIALDGCGSDSAGRSDGPAGSPENAGGSGDRDPGTDDGGSGNGQNTEPVTLDASEFTYSLEEGTSELPLWTAPATHRLTPSDRPPSGSRSGLALTAARREFEPAELILGPASGTVRVAVVPFARLGDGQRVELSEVGFVEGYAETLTPLANGDSVRLSTGSPAALWLTVFVPEQAPPGEHTTTLTLTPEGGDAVEVPVTLTVFDFTLPEEAHFATQINIDVSGLVPDGGSVDDAKTLLFEHRMTPASATWPSGFGWNITWDNPSSPTRCSAFYAEPDEGAEYSIQSLARRYLLGEDWNGVGFGDAEIFQFVDNSTPRPDSFCGVSRGDHYGTDSYNREWSDWLAALDDYLAGEDLTERVYYYVQNEPQNEEDDRLAAFLCRLTKAAAPHLRIAISEQPKPEIAEDPDGACGYDIWIAHVRAYQEDYAWQRQREHGEQVWFYSLDHDPDPYFRPSVAATQGMHQRIIPWAAWSHRIRGWAYYDGGRFFDGPRPRVRAELLREGFEDYEYLWLAAGSAYPVAGTSSPVDATVRSVAASMTSWTKDVDSFMAVRRELGRFIEGSRDSLPVLEATSTRPRGAYYLNFQDPSGEPGDEPLTVDGQQYLKVGWDAYDAEVGYGWSGEYIDDPAIALYGFDDVAGYSVLEQSYLYDDYGRDNLFEFDLAPGRYEVTVGVGRPARGYPNDPYNVTIEGTPVVDDEPTSDEAPTIVRTVTLDITDGGLSMVVGGRSESTGEYAYTFLAFLTIEPVD
jgi:hypothetical protein